MEPILLHGLAAFLYAALATHLWNTRWRAKDPAALAPMERAAILAPLALHSFLLWSSLFSAEQLRFGFGQALSATLWIAVTIYWMESLFVRVEGMQPLVLGLAALCVPLPALFPGLLMPAYTQALEFRLHLTMAMLAYGLFMIAALHALLMTLVERRLHGGAAGARAEAGMLGGSLANLPPLLTLEALLFRIITLGFALLTLTLATGAVFSETLFGQAMKFNHKTLFAVISWLIFAGLLIGRHLYGWRGRVALRWTLAGFISLLLAYVGSRFVLEVVLQRSAG
jgi:ABC-type uncharacterized transport system permease subunit